MNQYLFSGLKVIDCATVIAAPAAAMILADFGADVIKIEQPGSGDMLRLLSDISTTPDAGSDWFWQLDGRNKRSLAVDLKSDQGRSILLRLVSEADVFITNHPYPVREALGLTYDALLQVNPRLIYASLTAYGEQGPERDRKGFDQLAYWARSGLMEIMREPDTMPTQGLPGMGDHPTGVALYAGIVTALLHREKSGQGSFVHTSLLANGLWSAAGIAQGAMAGGDMSAYRDNNRIYPAMLRPYKTQDGRWLQFNMIRDEELLALTLASLELIQLLADPQFSSVDGLWTHRERLGHLIQEKIEARPADHWMSLFESQGLPINLVARIEDTVIDPQIRLNRMAVEPNSSNINTPWVINHPIQVSGAPQVGPIRAPDLGEQNEEILAELGYSSTEIQALKEDNVI
ncbi:MAG: CoA transferase [Gammaproteobacteria bacterium]|nr:CoA transferase [Gammaproteobacteria bacterium]